METNTAKNHEDVEYIEEVEEAPKAIDEKPAHEFSSPWHFSDVVLVVDDTKFHVHKCILSMWSPVFEKMFTSGFSEKNAKEIPLPGKQANEVEQLLKVIYSADAKQKVTEKNYEFLLELAREYQMDEVQQYCAQFMVLFINDKNCLHRYKIAERFGLEDVMEKCKEEARFQFSTDLEKSDDFRDLGVESKLKLCMTRMQDLEKALANYTKICSEMVREYYRKLSYKMPKDDIHQCDNISSHEFEYRSRYKEKIPKRVDVSCRFCRKRIDRYESKIDTVVNARQFHDYFVRMDDLEHDDKTVAKIREEMKASAIHQASRRGLREDSSDSN